MLSSRSRASSQVVGEQPRAGLAGQWPRAIRRGTTTKPADRRPQDSQGPGRLRRSSRACLSVRLSWSWHESSHKGGGQLVTLLAQGTAPRPALPCHSRSLIFHNPGWGPQSQYLVRGDLTPYSIPTSSLDIHADRIPFGSTGFSLSSSSSSIITRSPLLCSLYTLTLDYTKKKRKKEILFYLSAFPHPPYSALSSDSGCCRYFQADHHACSQ
jgi:hypothetical protein